MANPTRHAPRLSIGLPVYNGERLLPQAIECLLAQSFGDFEIVIGDNASTDRTQEICQDYVRRDPRIRYVRHEHNLGAVANFNRVFELSAAPLFKWAAHDDLHRETYLEACISLLDAHPDLVLAHSGTAFVDERGNHFPSMPRPAPMSIHAPAHGKRPIARLSAIARTRSNGSGRC